MSSDELSKSGQGYAQAKKWLLGRGHVQRVDSGCDIDLALGAPKIFYSQKTFLGRSYLFGEPSHTLTPFLAPISTFTGLLLEIVQIS